MKRIIKLLSIVSLVLVLSFVSTKAENSVEIDSFSNTMSIESYDEVQSEKDLSNLFYEGAKLKNEIGDNLFVYNGSLINLSTGEAQPLSVVGGILLFVAGIAVGYVFGTLVNGALIYYTGYSGDQYVAMGLAALSAYRKGQYRGAASMHINIHTKKIVSAYTSSGCLVHMWEISVCPYRAIVD